MSISDEVLERAWAAIVGHDIAANCYQASIIRADLRVALEAAFAAQAEDTESRLASIERRLDELENK